MNILFYDTESTGLPKWKEPSEGENQPHIVSLAGILADSDTREVYQKFYLVSEADGWESEADALAKHRITTEKSAAVGIPEDEVVSMLLAVHEKANLRVAHSQSFDARIVRIGLKRFFDDGAADRWKAAPAECTMKMCKGIVPVPPGIRGVSLETAYRHFWGQPPPGHHNALADAEACMRIYFALQDGVDQSTAVDYGGDLA